MPKKTKEINHIYSATELDLLSKCGIDPIKSKFSPEEAYYLAAIRLIKVRDFGFEADSVGKAIAALSVGHPVRPSEEFDKLIGSTNVNIGEGVVVGYEKNGPQTMKGYVIGTCAVRRIAISDGKQTLVIDHTLSGFKGDYQFKPVMMSDDAAIPTLKEKIAEQETKAENGTIPFPTTALSTPPPHVRHTKEPRSKKPVKKPASKKKK
jgi:hypothetical protein